VWHRCSRADGTTELLKVGSEKISPAPLTMLLTDAGKGAQERWNEKLQRMFRINQMLGGSCSVFFSFVLSRRPESVLTCLLVFADAGRPSYGLNVSLASLTN